MGKELSKDIQEQNDLIRKLPTAQAEATKKTMEGILSSMETKDGKFTPSQQEQLAKAAESHNNAMFRPGVDADKTKKEAAAKIRAGDVVG